MRVGFIEPCGESNPAGNRVEFADDETLLGEEQVGTNDAGEGLAEGFVAGEGDEFRRFSLLEELGDPGRLFPRDGERVEFVAGLLKNPEAMSQFFEFLQEAGREREGAWREEPVLFRKKTLGWERGLEFCEGSVRDVH
jgi:hypothetical protein